MRASSEPKLAKWPFLLGDLLLLGAAFFVYCQSRLPMSLLEMALILLCVLAGAVLCIIPFLAEYRAAVKLAEAGALTSVVAQIQHLETVGAQISGATAQWQSVQEEAKKTSEVSKGIADKMAAEVQAFTDFMQRMNDSEKSTLRLEVDKLRRAEGEWLQVLVRLLDHIYALHAGALRSGQPSLIQQVSQFQNACRDVARRVGLTPFTPELLDAFDAQRHQPFEAEGKVTEGAQVAETIATGYTFQGRLIRPALVRLNGAGAAAAEPQSQLPLAGTDAGQK